MAERTAGFPHPHPLQIVWMKLAVKESSRIQNNRSDSRTVQGPSNPQYTYIDYTVWLFDPKYHFTVNKFFCSLSYYQLLTTQFV